MAIKQLTLLGTTVKGIAEYDGLLFHVTEAGVDVHNLLGERVAYAALANTTSGTVNSNGVYLGTTAAGVYKLAHAAVATGGDQTSALVQTITTATTPAIASNAIAGMAGNGTALLITTDAGADFLPDTSTVYSYTDAGGCVGGTINATEIAYIIASGNVHRLDHPTANWTSGDATVYTADEGTPTMAYETGYSATNYPYALVASADGSHLLFACLNGSTCLWMMTFSGGTLLKSASYATSTTCRDVALDSDDTHVAAADSASPYITWYTKSGGTITAQAGTISALPGLPKSLEWCPSNNVYLAIAHEIGSGIALSLYKRNGTTSIDALAAPTQPSGNGIQLAWNGNYLAVATDASPYLAFYRRDGDTLTKLTDAIDVAPASTAYKLEWNGNYLLASASSSPYLYLYEFDPEEETLTKQTGVPTITGTVGSFAWNDDGTLLGLSWNSAPYLELYTFASGTFNKVAEAGTSELSMRAYRMAWLGSYIAVAVSGDGVIMYEVSTAGGGDLQAPAVCLALATDLFVGSEDGIDIFGASSRAIASPDENPIAALCPTPTATTTTGKLAYGTSDGQNGGQFGVIDLSA